MPDTMIQVTGRTVDGLPENFVTNQFCISEVESSQTAWDAIVAAFRTFYSSIGSNLWGASMAQNGHIIKFYDKPGPTPNYPYYETTFNLTSAPSGAELPSEVALCLSFQGLRVPGFPQARRRGRVYLGPLKATINSSGRPASAVRTSLVGFAETLYDAIDAISGTGIWSVWSSLDGEAVGLHDCWVDDTFDTQRSRGLQRTAKTTLVF